MLKNEYVKDFAKRTSLSNKLSRDILDSVYFHLLECLEEHNKVFSPIGKVVVTKEYLGSHKQTVKKIEITLWSKREVNNNAK